MNNVDQLKVTKSLSLRHALEILEQSGASILLLVDEEGRLLRTVTDGDIRRLLLAGSGLDESLEQLPEGQPVVAQQSSSDEDVLKIMDQHSVNQIPLVDDVFRPVALSLRRELSPRIMLSIPHLGEYERQYVEEAFSTNWIAPLGPNVDAFENEIAQYVGVEHAAALSSGTAAIHLALRLLEVERDDVVLCSSFTFVASANPILYQGARPVFVDSEPATWNMSPQALERALKDFQTQGIKPKAILVVHLYGQSADMDAIMVLSRQYDVPVIEDAAESLGAYYKGQHTGTFGTFGVFSFNGNKIITTSGGGMLISNDGALIEKARFLSTQARDPAPHYEHSEVGYNYRMSNVLAGIGRGQLKVLDERVASKRQVFERYQSALAEVEALGWMPEPEGDFSNRWLSAITINPDNTSVTPIELIDYLAANNIEARPVWKPMHRQPLFADCTYYPHSETLSVCDQLFERGICLPSASNMTEQQQNRVIELIHRCIG